MSAWLEDNLPDGFTVFDFPLEHRRHIRTTNSLERVNKEIRHRTGVVGIFPNEESCLRLISALLMEISEEWQSGKRFCATKPIECQRTVVTFRSILQKKVCIIDVFGSVIFI
ncbi:transposase [Anaerolinea thermophila]|uniref:transposase n=1 Tax=Anaerolinea thermophila TaxID=167964 RepID=UPI00342C9596